MTTQRRLFALGTTALLAATFSVSSAGSGHATTGGQVPTPYWRASGTSSQTRTAPFSQPKVRVNSAQIAPECVGAAPVPTKSSNKIFGTASQTCRGIATQTVCATLYAVDYFGSDVAKTKPACKSGGNGTVSVSTTSISCSSGAFKYYTYASWHDTTPTGAVSNGDVESNDLNQPC